MSIFSRAETFASVYFDFVTANGSILLARMVKPADAAGFILPLVYDGKVVKNVTTFTIFVSSCPIQ